MISSCRVWSVVCSLCISFSPPGPPLSIPPSPSRLLRPVPEPRPGPGLRWPAHCRHEAGISGFTWKTQVPPTPLAGTVAVHSPVSGTVQGLSITGKHQMGRMEAILQKMLSLASSVAFPAGNRVARKHTVLSLAASPPELQMASPST